jgi:OmpA-OmpF porin, OOP family
MRFMSIALVTGISLILGGCADSKLINKVSGMKSTQSGFKAGLHKKYVALAKMELEEGDYFDTGIFARRAEAAAMGKGVDPDFLYDRHFTAKNLKTIAMERTRLVKALNSGGREKYPDYASTAQTQFDCWAQELEENNQPPDIERCRVGYLGAMKKLLAAMKPAPKVVMKPAPKPKPKKKMVKKVKRTVKKFVVYFDFDSTKLANEESVRILAEAAEAAKSSKSKSVWIVGHTDTSGSKDYNMKLSERRSAMVGKSLVAAGVNSSIIEPASVGERVPEVSTKDGVREAANRRVVIMVH